MRSFGHTELELHEDIVLIGTYAKFAQNPPLHTHLVATDNRNIAVASPFDVLWGIGMPASHQHAAQPTRWKR